MQQQAGEIGATALAAGQRADRGVQADAAEQRFDDLARTGLRGPFIVGAPLERRLAHGGVVVERIALVEHAESQAAPLGHAALVGLLRAVEQMQQRGLAVAVAADDADAVAFESPCVTSVNMVFVAKASETCSSPRS